MRLDPKRKILALLRRRGVIRPRDLVQAGIPRVYLQRLTAAGEIERVERGLYRLPESDITEKHGYVQVAKRSPKAVVCLLSALRFHDIGTQLPHEIWIALPPGAWRPRIAYPPVRVSRFSGTAFTAGVERHRAEGVPVRVYSPAKTVADCFKYRNKVGLDVALEALREAWRGRRCTMDELWHYARVCRVQNVMRPYLEALTA